LFYSSGSTFPVGSIPIVRSTLRCFPMAFVLGEAFARFSVSKASMRPDSSRSLRHSADEERDFRGGASNREIQRRICARIHQIPNWTSQSGCLTILLIVRTGANQYGVRNNYQ
jgi:hypothetical protein